MAQSNTFATTNPGSAVANVEQLARGAHLTSPSNSPFYSNTKKVKAKSTTPEWVVDDFKTLSNTVVAEGQDYTTFEDAFDQQERVFNYINAVDVSFKVTDVQEMVDNAAGVNFAGALKKKLIELNMTTELVALSANARGLSGSTRTAAGLAEQLSGASGIFSANYETPAAQSTTPSGNAATETNVDAVLRSLFDSTGNKGTFRVYAGSAWMNSFATNTMRLTDASNNLGTTVNLNGENGVIKNKVRLYMSQHGSVEVVDLNTLCTPDVQDAFFIDPEMVEVQELGGLDVRKLPDLGGGPRAGIRRHFCVCVKNAKNHGYWNNLS